MNYVGLAVAQSALLQRIGDPKTEAGDLWPLIVAFERLLAVEYAGTIIEVRPSR